MIFSSTPHCMQGCPMFAKLYLEIAEASNVVTSRYNRQDADQMLVSGQNPVRQCHHDHYISGGLGLGLARLSSSTIPILWGCLGFWFLRELLFPPRAEDDPGSAKVRIVRHGLGYPAFCRPAKQHRSAPTASTRHEVPEEAVNRIISKHSRCLTSAAGDAADVSRPDKLQLMKMVKRS